MPSQDVKAAHIVPKSLTSQELAYLYGVEEVVLNDPRNGMLFNFVSLIKKLTGRMKALLLHQNIEKALDSARIVIIPIPSPKTTTTSWQLLLIDQSSRNQMVYNDTHGKVLWKVGYPHFPFTLLFLYACDAGPGWPSS